MKLGCTTLLCVALLALCGDALAEGRERPSPTARTSGERARATALKKATNLVSSMGLRANRIHRELRQARSKKLVQRSRCLDRALSMAHAVERQGNKELKAVERLVRTRAFHRGRLSAHLTRLATIDARSRFVLQGAEGCGRVSRRPRAPTHYSVKVIRPNLPPLERVFSDDQASAPPRPQPRKRVRTARK